MATRAEVEGFLRELMEKIRVFEIVFRPRDKNLKALADLDITAVRRLEYIMKLKEEDYYSGPNKDICNTALPDYFEFGIQVKGVEVYIKINKGLINKPADCMSFHPAEFPMAYPLKNK
jgi:hypothetical protein